MSQHPSSHMKLVLHAEASQVKGENLIIKISTGSALHSHWLAKLVVAKYKDNYLLK